MPTKAKTRSRKGQPDLITAVGDLLNDLASLGYEPTLVGGMALVILGSRRVTRDFDFLVVEEARDRKSLVRSFYRHGLQLVSEIDEHGNPTRTIDNAEVASARLRIDRPKSAYFYNHNLGLRVDLLFDFPLQACEVRRRSSSRKIQSYSFHIAAKADLVRMKEIAVRDRHASSDVQDLEFLRKL